jgi:Flp pilus assembly protein TadG
MSGWRRRGETGSAVLEAVIAAPVIMLLVVFVIGVARLANARQLVDDAAGDAARSATAAISADQARSAATQTARISLAGRGVSCSPLSVAVDLSDWRPGGTVGVTVSCTAQLGDLAPLPFAGSRTVTARAASVLDPYRQLSGGSGS